VEAHDDTSRASARTPHPNDDVERLLEELARHELPLREIEDRYIRAVVRYAHGKKTRAARLLGVNRTTLYRRGC